MTDRPLSSYTPEELAETPKVLDAITETDLDKLDDDTYDVVDLARGLVKDRIDSENYEVPDDNIEIHYYPNKEVAFDRRGSATLFILESFLKADAEKNPLPYKIIALIAPPMDTNHGTCGVPILANFKKAHPDHVMNNRGTGAVHKNGDGKINIGWGPYPGHTGITTNPNDCNYMGPHPSKFENWIVTQLKSQLEEN